MNRYVGIDKTELRNIEVCKINIDRLQSDDVIATFTESELGYLVQDTEGNYHRLERIKVKPQPQQVFSEFRVDYEIKNGVREYYVKLVLTIPREGRDSNLVPMPVWEYKNYLESIRSYLASTYGIYIDMSEARLYMVELNITSQMRYPLHDYRLIFEGAMIKRNQKKYRFFRMTGEGDRKFMSYELFSTKTKKEQRSLNILKIYDKTEQLANCFKIYEDNQYMRMEYVFTTYKMIESRLGTSYIADLTDDIVRDFLSENIQEDIFKPVEAYINDSNKQLKKIYTDIKKKHKRGYIRQFAQYSSQKEVQILDMEQVVAIAKKDMIKSNHFKLNYKIVDEVMPNILKNNYDKLAELKDKFILD